MAIEAFPKSKIREVHWPKTFSYILTGAFLILLSSYFILIFLQARLTDELSVLERKLERTQDETELEKNVLDAKKRIEDWKFLITHHTMPFNVFELLQSRTHPEVWFTDFMLDTGNSLMSLGGRAESFEVLSQQLKIFESEESFRGMNLSNITVVKGGEVMFDLQLQLDPSVFKQ
ncbi:MAG: hypothetical protein G01um101430_134 [Parcubacteria group bacterium Gr01-1014_30]|nr:MAG: hypothetical protein G01um101430_134 [Parcubacteria group bacterium Gr01-1014_30]